MRADWFRPRCDCRSSMPTTLSLDAFDLSDDEVRGRFDWAVRRGHPHWLWPDTTVEAWQDGAWRSSRPSPAQVLTVGHAREPLHGRPEDIGVAGYTSGMGPLLGSWLRQGADRRAGGVGAMLELHIRHNALRMAAMRRRATAVVDALARSGVEVVVLKGMHTACSVIPRSRHPAAVGHRLADRSGRRDRSRTRSARPGLHAGPDRPLSAARNWRMADAPTMPRTLAFVHRTIPGRSTCRPR